ncbi:MAG: hypothetical protein UZ22_OP11002001042 [Microgenomates bacterium OLB23]|nr:MAG: hypothetical protein UZ22_OP11002001042 [Microgenomates bacterium OLB23]
MLAYPVIPGVKQEYLCPVWLSRSQGRLESGYDGLFVESAAAVADSRCAKPAVLGATIAQNTLPNPNPTVIDAASRGDTLQYKNFTVQGEPQSESSCPVKDQFTNALEISDGVYIAWIDRNERSAGNRRLGTPGQLKGALVQREWWIAVTTSQQVAGALGSGEDIPASVRSEYLQFRVSRAIKCQIGSRDVCPLPSGLSGSIVACKYLTTGSPSLYINSSTPQNITVSINPVGGISFAQPAPQQPQLWSFTTAANGGMRFANNTTSDRIYWEYNKKALTNALTQDSFKETGYVVRKEQLLDVFTATIAPQLKLTPTQTSDLLGEIKRESDTLSQPYVKVILLPRAILDKYLPVSISPAPKNFSRYFFIIKGTHALDLLEEPQLSPAPRTSFDALELGTLFPAQ